MTSLSMRYIVCLLLVVDAIARCQTTSGSTPNAALLAGDYVRSDYLETLRKTNSPLKSLMFDTPQMAVVDDKGPQGEIVNSIFNFHEGGASFLLSRGSLRPDADGGFSLSNLAFKVIDSRHFVLGFDRFPASTYTFVGDLARFMRGVLVGVYSDQSGRPYAFRDDGTANFAGRTFRYTVGADQVINRFDYFQDDTEHKVFGFKRVGNTVEVFRTKGELGQEVEEKPFLLLTRHSGK